MRLGEPEDKDSEKDLSAGAGGGGGEGVCDGGGGDGGEESMVGPTREEGIETMEGNRDVEMGIGGEGVGVRGEREHNENWKGKEDSSNTTSREK